MTRRPCWLPGRLCWLQLEPVESSGAGARGTLVMQVREWGSEVRQRARACARVRVACTVASAAAGMFAALPNEYIYDFYCHSKSLEAPYDDNLLTWSGLAAWLQTVEADDAARRGQGPAKPAPRWVGNLIAALLRWAGPKGVEFGMYSVDYHYIRWVCGGGRGGSA